MDDDGKEFVIAYASRSNNNVEAQYSSYEGECLATIWAIAHFRCYLYGNEFLLVTDHQPLKWLMESDKLTGKLARWALILMEYDFKVVHRAGLVNMDADGLSPNPIPSQVDATGAISSQKSKVNPMGYSTVVPTKTSYDLASVTMAFTFMKPASSTSSWLSLRDNSAFVMHVVRSVPLIDVLIVHGYSSKVSFVSSNPATADAPSING
jgi:hypothetical protein